MATRSPHPARGRGGPADAAEGHQRPPRAPWSAPSGRCPTSRSSSSATARTAARFEHERDAVGGEGWIRFAGRTSDEELVDWYRRAWVVCSASRREGFGLTLTEAAACGTPVVATRIPGHVDAVAEGRSGLLATGTDELGDELARLLLDDELRAKMGVAALEHAEAFRWEASASALLHALADDADSSSMKRRRGRLPRPRCTIAARWSWAGAARLNADTKQYLYLDPRRPARPVDARCGTAGSAAAPSPTRRSATSGRWGPTTPSWTRSGLPDWVAQRLWVGGLQLVAALGALALLRRLLPATWLHVPAALAYGLSPFVLGHVTGQSGLLVPFAGLPWLVLVHGQGHRAPRSWRWPAALRPDRHHLRLAQRQLGVLRGAGRRAVGARSPCAEHASRPRAARRACACSCAPGALTLVTQLWWLVGLRRRRWLQPADPRSSPRTSTPPTPPPARRRCCAASATGSSTAATPRGRGSPTSRRRT